MPGGAGPEGDRAALEAAWLELTRVILPGLAAERGWPVSADHCFQRILLDAAVGGVWYEAVRERPAYRHIAIELLGEAVRLARAVADGSADLAMLDRQSLACRRAARAHPSVEVR